MSKTIEQLEEVIKGFSGELAAIQKREQEIIDAVGVQADELSKEIEAIEDEDEREGVEDLFRDVLGEFAGQIDQYWGGEDAYDYGEWNAGESVSFWVPSNC